MEGGLGLTKREEKVAFNRGRSCRKNDQAYVEDCNWLAIRRRVVYGRLASKQAYTLLGELLPLLGLQLNFLRPIRVRERSASVGAP